MLQVYSIEAGLLLPSVGFNYYSFNSKLFNKYRGEVGRGDS
jgi:hypothetical protein